MGHLAAAQAVRDTMGLDRVDFLVANDPWQKSSDRVVTSAVVRLEMVRAMVDGHDGLGVDDREIRRGGLTYTVDTLEDLAKEQPETDVFLIVGQDTANRLNTWHRYEEVLALSTLVIVNRAENSAQDPEMLSGARVQNVSMPRVDVSSTRVRASVSSGESITGLTSDAVASVIRQRGLYGASA
jgi:nicotinate-nucleotide adenylyltransferase